MSTNQSGQVIQEDWTLEEICHQINRYVRKVKLKTLYDWLPYAGIKTKPAYSYRDLKKLFFIANSLNRVRSLDHAKERLRQDLKANPGSYRLEPTGVPYGTTINVECRAS